jgi:hypothetical protein
MGKTQENPIWDRLCGWKDDIEKIALGDFEDPRKAVMQLAEFVCLLAEEVGQLMMQ